MWKAIWEFINSNWGTSIITGFLVTIIWEWGKRFRDRRHYLESIELGNERIFDIIESSISEKQFLSDEVLLSLPKSVSKECKVHIEDLAPLTLIMDSVIKKIIESNFLSHDNKIQYSNDLITIRKRIENLQQETNKQDSAVQYINKHLSWLRVKPQSKKISVSFISLLIGCIVTVMFMSIALWKGDINSSNTDIPFISKVITSVTGALLAAMASFQFGVVFRRYQSKKKNNQPNEASQNDDL
ncbi:hypothetical protein [Priestia megaterium]|uniref:hypothetical protein n=1 Tax=Priestia megaterium TaxID=1404 RepID=UPI00237BECA8|nr:hypothetical protein [Priestia megaterium]MDD9791660.1 hypothetical protein [Priestia megaterium]